MCFSMIVLSIDKGNIMSKLSSFYSVGVVNILICLMCFIHASCQSEDHSIQDPYTTSYNANTNDDEAETPTSVNPDQSSPSPSTISSILDFEWPIIQYQPPRLRRLTRLQFQNNIHTLLGQDIIVPILSSK